MSIRKRRARLPPSLVNFLFFRVPSQRSKLANYLSSGRRLSSQQTIAFRVVEGYQVLELACLRVARFAFSASRLFVGLGIFPAID